MKIKLAILFCLTALASFGQTLTPLFNYAPANGSTNGSSITLSGIYVPRYTVFLQHGGITNAVDYQTNVVSGVTNVVNTRTNIVRTSVQFSLDGSNWVTVDTVYPSSTNAGIYTLYPSNTIPLYMRASVFTSNSIPVGLIKQ